MRLSCSSGTRNGTPFVVCSWSRPADRAVAQYRVWREHDGTRRVIATLPPDATTHADRDVVVGATYQYLVEALDRAGGSVGRTPVVGVACCEAGPPVEPSRG